MQKNKKSVWLLVLFSFFVLVAFQKTVQADVKMNNRAVTIDGEFDDWPKSSMNAVGDYKFAFKNDGTNLYVYVSMKAYDRFREIRWNLSDGNHTAQISIKPNTYENVQPGGKIPASAVLYYSAPNDSVFVGNTQGGQTIAGSTGIVTTVLGENNSYSDQAEIKIPLAGFLKNPQSVKTFNMTLSDGIGNQTFTITNANATDNSSTDSSTSSSTDSPTSSSTDSPTSSTSSSEQPVKPDINGNQGTGGPIVIDGSYDDWIGKPWKDIYKEGEAPNQYHPNGTATKRISAVRDEKYLYLFIDMNPYKMSHDYRFQGNAWKIQIGNDTANLWFLPETASNPGNPDWGSLQSIQPGQKAPIVAWLNTSSTPDGIILPAKNWGEQEIKGSQGFVTTETFHTDQDNQNHYRDRAEIKIPLDGLVKDPKLVKEIKISNDQLGDQIIEVTGGSTGSTVIILSGIAIAGGVVYRLSKKKKELSK